MENNKGLIYLFGFSPNKVMQLENLIRIINEQINNVKISVVLLHDAVIGLSNKGHVSDLVQKLLTLPIKLFALSPDILARGINIKDINQVIKCINYDELVELIVKNNQVVSWM